MTRNVNITVSSSARYRTFINGRLIYSSYPLSLAERLRWVWWPRLRRRFR